MINDLYRYQVINNDLVDLQEAIVRFAAAGIYLSAIPNSRRCYGQGGTGLSYSGTWGNDTAYGGSVGKVTFTNGDTATWQGVGHVALVGVRWVKGSDAYQTVTLNGAPHPVVLRSDAQNGADITTGFGRAYSTALYRIEGLDPSTVNTLVFTNNNTTGLTNPFIIDWIQTDVDFSANFIVCVSGCLRTAASRTDLPDSLTYIGEDILNKIAVAAVNDGAMVVKAATRYRVNNTTDIDTDGLHPLDSGHAEIAVARIAAIDRGLAGNPNGLWNIDIDGTVSLPTVETIIDGFVTGQTITFTKQPVVAGYSGYLTLNSDINANGGEDGIWLITQTGTQLRATPILANANYTVSFNGSNFVEITNASGQNRTMRVRLEWRIGT